MNPSIESFNVWTHLYLEPLLMYKAPKVTPAGKMPRLMCATGRTRPEEGFIVLRKTNDAWGGARQLLSTLLQLICYVLSHRQLHLSDPPFRHVFGSRTYS